MAIKLVPDLGEEIIQKLGEIGKYFQIVKGRLDEKDKKIQELEEKLKRLTQNGG
ncbi:MAG: hypothetical protein NT076_04210 [Candidatus Pacearchaeota archaeon]|nr:hypothetical protein [Candidatus Pacearchaeota archaeon]